MINFSGILQMIVRGRVFEERGSQEQCVLP